MFLAEFPDGQVIVVILMVLFAGIKSLMEKIKSQQGESSDSEETDYDPMAEFYEETSRQLREQRETVLLRQQGFVEDSPPPLPPVYVAPAPVKRPQIKKPTLSALEQEALKNLQKQKVKEPLRKRPRLGTARARALRVLSSPSAARDAVVLSEILGPPKGQQS
ncbi:MAG: hypothetical protein ACKVLL_10730 [Verrucomicrobiales bacterium]|jgi:hypothetical protein